MEREREESESVAANHGGPSSPSDPTATMLAPLSPITRADAFFFLAFLFVTPISW